MREIAVRFDAVWKSYPSYHHITRGIKSFLFNLPQAVRELYSRRTALEDVSFEIYKGENFGFIGNNGAGKSTTLGLIAGVLSPDQGSIHVRGRVSPLLELGAGFHPELTGRDNILLNGVLLGLTKDEVRAHEEEILEFADLGEFIDMPVRTYSSGMFAKLGFAVVATLKPEILLLDEILAVGDIAFQHKCKATFEKFRQDPNVTMILVSHGLESVAEVCDRVAWIEGKTVRMVGEADEVIREYKAAHAYTVQAVGSASGYLPCVVAPGVTELDCSVASAVFLPRINAPFLDATLRISLFQKEDSVPLGHWIITPQIASFHVRGQGLVLETTDGEACFFVSDVKNEQALDLLHPLTLSLQVEGPEGPQSAACWLPLCVTVEARQKYDAAHKRLLATAAGNGFPPHLWPGGKTVRVVARNIMVNDAVGNFAVGMMATLARYGIPVRLYSYISCAELAGLVSSIGDLEQETDSDDIVFYHYSTEDEFLPLIANLACRRKILYYHNVTPAHWFNECCPDLAQALERSRKQYPLFASFDAVVANSSFSLEDVLPHVSSGIPTSVFPPSMSLDRLRALRPEPVPVPEATHIILWVGRAVPHKRPDVALRLFDCLSHLRDDTALVMVASGRHDFPQQLRLLEEQLNALPEDVRARVHMVEGLTDAHLAWLYQRASLFLCTSGHEGYCLPVYEAMSFGLPVATLPQPAVEETLSGRGTILPNDIDAAAHILHNLLKSRKPREDSSKTFFENTPFEKSRRCGE